MLSQSSVYEWFNQSLYSNLYSLSDDWKSRKLEKQRTSLLSYFWSTTIMYDIIIALVLKLLNKFLKMYSWEFKPATLSFLVFTFVHALSTFSQITKLKWITKSKMEGQSLTKRNLLSRKCFFFLSFFLSFFLFFLKKMSEILFQFICWVAIKCSLNYIVSAIYRGDAMTLCLFPL